MQEQVILVGDDTDLLILLIHKCANLDNQKIFFKPQPKTTQKTKAKIWDIKHVSKSLPSEIVKKHILLLHALHGCDTTSKLPGLRTDILLRLLIKSKEFQEHSSRFTCASVTSTPDNVISSGLSILALLFKSSDTLDATRAIMFNEKSRTHSELSNIDRYPPTETAAIFHIRRIFLQISSWNGVQLDPLIWGFFVRGGKMLPIMTTRDVAPDTVLA